MIKLGVTGTDTSVGKTVIATSLVALLRSRGLGAGVMKPVETGVTRGEAGSDHVLLAVSAGADPDGTEVCPLVFEDPLAPWIAARRSRKEIDVELLDAAFRRACEGKDAVIVEGAGGLLVPITRSFRFDTLFARWDLELIIVAADRLGAINHTMLTVEAALRAGLRIRGIVMNRLHEVSPMPPGAENAVALRELIPDIPIAEFPCVEGLHGGRRLHPYGSPLDIQLLRDVASGTGLVSMLFGSGG